MQVSLEKVCQPVQDKQACATCKGWMPAQFRIPGIPGAFCSIGCLETELFGVGHCRWCGDAMDKPYTSIDSRLCGDDCSSSYYSHLEGDRTARLGSGKRLQLWIQKKRPALYRQIIGSAESVGRRCQNPSCPNGTDGFAAILDHLRAGTRFCSATCKKHAKRGPNPDFSPSKRAVFIGVSRDTLAGLDLGGIPVPPAPQIASYCEM
jgi:hypothetical protein